MLEQSSHVIVVLSHKGGSMRKIRLKEEIEKDLLSLRIAGARGGEGSISKLNSEQDLDRCVSGILKCIRETYNPHIHMSNLGYDRKDGTVVMRISDGTYLNTSATVKVRQDLKVIHQSREFYVDSELRVLDEFLSCWNKVVM